MTGGDAKRNEITCFKNPLGLGQFAKTKRSLELGMEQKADSQTETPPITDDTESIRKIFLFGRDTMFPSLMHKLKPLAE